MNRNDTKVTARVDSITTHRVILDLAQVASALPATLTDSDRVELILDLPDQRSRTILLTYRQVQSLANLVQRGY
jgi:hypothetical protein